MASKESSSIYDFFISYKHVDTAEFAANLKAAISDLNAEVWLDSERLHPGDSLLSGIENGIKDSIDAIIIMSEHYFTGWSATERAALTKLMVSKKLRIIPIWYRLDAEQVEELAPMSSDILAIRVEDGSEKSARRAAAEIMGGYSRWQRRSRLFELFFEAVYRHVKDPDLEIWIAVFSGDTGMLEKAVQAGGNVNIRDSELWNRYNRIILEHKDVFPAWRRLFMYLHEEGAIGGGSDE